MYAIRFSPSIENDIQRGWSAWMGMRYSSFLILVNTAFEVDEYHYSEWCDERDLDAETEGAAEKYVSDYLGWDVRLDPATNEMCVVHHDGLSVYVVDEENLQVNLDTASDWNARNSTADGFGHATQGRVTIVAQFGNWHVLEVESTTPED